MLRQFWLYNCTCTGGAYTLPWDGPNHEHFMSIWHGQESEIQNVPGLGSGFLYPPCGALFPWVTGGSHSCGNTWEDRATWGCPLDWFLQLLRACCICVKAVASDFTVFWNSQGEIIRLGSRIFFFCLKKSCLIKRRKLLSSLLYHAKLVTWGLLWRAGSHAVNT